MAYSPTTDFLALLRDTPGGELLARAPGLDIIMTALARAGMFRIWVGQSAPVDNQLTTAWLQPAQPSWTAEGAFRLWDPTTSTYVAATPGLWAALLTSQYVLASPGVFQSIRPTDVTLAMSPYTALITDQLLMVDTAAGAVVVNLTAALTRSGLPLEVKDATGHADVNPITVNSFGAELIDGKASVPLDSIFVAVKFQPKTAGGYAIV